MTEKSAVLSAHGGERPLVTLQTRRGVTRARRGAFGLYHFAVLLPERSALGRFAVLYPKGGVGSSTGGALWRMSVDRFDDLYCSYFVGFEPDFDFVKGGKLPGLAGGAANTGGRKPTGTDGWSARMMWRARGEVVRYVYHVDQPTIYGEDFQSDSGGQRLFRPGTWHRVEHRIMINTPGQRDGTVQGLVRRRAGTGPARRPLP